MGLKPCGPLNAKLYVSWRGTDFIAPQQENMTQGNSPFLPASHRIHCSQIGLKGTPETGPH